MNRILFLLFIISSFSAFGGLEEARVAADKGDFATAYKEWLQEAQKGDLDAQYLIAMMLLDGIGVPPNAQKAVEWLKKSASSGSPDAQYQLGSFYITGRATLQDYSQALLWSKKAAEQGHSEAQYNIAYLYINGLGVTKNKVFAHAWLSISANQGLESAKTLLNQIEPSMSAGEIQQANNRAIEIQKKFAY